MHKEHYIEKNIDELFVHSLSKVTLWGALLFLLLGIMDYVFTPENFNTFISLRISVSFLLFIIFLLTRKSSSRSICFYQTLAYIAVFASAVAIEIMILIYGGHISPYYAGMMLLGILVLGFIPARFLFNFFSAMLLYGIFLFPMLLTKKITDFSMFFTSNAFIVTAFLSVLVLRYLNTKRLINELALKYDLEKQENHLKTLVRRRSAELSGIFSQLTDEVAGREKAEERIKSHIERQKAHHSIDMTITSSHDLQNILDVLLTEVIAKLNIDAADVLLFKQEDKTLEYAAHKGFKSERIKQVKLDFGQSCAGHAALLRKKIVIPDISAAKEKCISTFYYRFSDSYLVKEDSFKSYIVIPLIAKGYVNGVLEIFHRSVLNPDDEWLDFLDNLANKAAIALDNVTMFENLELSKEELLKAYDMTIEGLARALDYRDHETKGHSTRVTEMTIKIARLMGMSDEELIHVRRGAFLHDIGKLAVPDNILLKPGPLTDQEWLINKMHPLIAYEMLSPISFLNPAMDIPYCHHEKWDGTGYPRGLKGKEIPLAARIFALVDIWDALSFDRPYRPALSKEKVMEHIKSLSGNQLDPEVVDAFFFIQDTIENRQMHHISDPIDNESFTQEDIMKYYDE